MLNDTQTIKKKIRTLTVFLTELFEKVSKFRIYEKKIVSHKP